MRFFDRWLRADAGEQHATCLQRRRLLRAMAGSAALMAVPSISNANITLPKNQRALAFAHTHTGEQLSVVYKAGDTYLPQSMAKIAYLMRDFRSGDVHPIDPALLDVLWQVQSNLKTSKPFEIISAYRSPATNDKLRGKSSHSGVAKKSMHLSGQAIDIRLPGLTLADVRDAALDIKRGGVGYYPDSNFVHVDTGRVRHW